MLKPETTTSIDGARQELGLTYYYKAENDSFYPYLHNHEFYELTYVKSGKIIHYVNNGREVIMPGTLLFIRPDDVHRLMPLNDKGFEVITICISYEIMDDIMKFLEMEVHEIHRKASPPKRIFPNSQGRYIVSMLDHMMDVIDNEPDEKAVLRCLKTQMAHFIYTLVTMDNTGRVMPQWLRNVVNEMDKEENFTAGYDRMIELSGVSPAHLSREMKVFFDMSPTEYIGTKRVTLAKKLFAEGETNMTEIYKRCGFGSLSNFYLVFKKQTGLNPGEYMKSL